jgi:mitotic spindle assembly checkpoint protein MAD2
MSSAVAQKVQSQEVTLKGSAQLVSEFFNYGINSILYQRGIYPSESFTRKQEYGLTLLVSTDEKVNNFLKSVLSQIQEWLVERKVKKLVVVLTNVETKEVLERWEFKVEYETEDEDSKTSEKDENVNPNIENQQRLNQQEGKTDKRYANVSRKDDKSIRKEIGGVIRQITASVSFLPLLDCICSFDILIYSHKDLEVPLEWGESDACLIQNSEEVKLRSFSTNIHRVEAAVSYKAE